MSKHRGQKLGSCVCGHKIELHQRPRFIAGPLVCVVANCDCTGYKQAGYRQAVSGTSKYCQSTTPPDYTPSPEPEPLQW